MWPVFVQVAVAEASAWQQYVLPAALAVFASLGAALLAMRGTFKTASINHETEFDKLVHARIAALEQVVADREARINALVEDRDRYREQYARLRVATLNAGLDPDQLSDRGGGHAATP